MKKNKRNLSPIKTETSLKVATISETIEARIELIRFDKKTKVFIFLLLGLYALSVVFKLNGSSVGMWNTIIPAEGISKKTGIIMGTPKSIRSDEWLGHVPFHVAQYYNDFHYQNPTLGPLNTPLVWYMPNHHIVNSLRPSYWGSYFLDLEREYSYFWCYRIFMTIFSYFLFFMLVTKNNFSLSVFASLWGFLTASNQWWSLYLGDMTAYLLLVFVNLIYVLYAKDRKIIIMNAIFLLLSSFSFACDFYPAWQVPFVYFFVIFFAGYVLDNFYLKEVLKEWKVKVLALGLSVVVLLLALLILYLDIKDTSELMMSTRYPGKRFATGGGYSLKLVFSAFFGYFISDGKLPQQWGNISEISKYLMFFPVPIFLVIRNFVLKRAVSFISIFLSMHILIMLIFMTVGFPSELSLISLFKFTPADRMTSPLGFVNLVLTIIFISESNRYFIKSRPWILATICVGVILFVIYFINETNAYTNNFFKQAQLFPIFLFTIITYVCLVLIRNKGAYWTFIVLVVLYLTPNFYTVNPINIGLPAFTKHPFATILKSIKKEDPEAKWVVFGNIVVPGYLKAYNIKVINGLTTAPNYSMLNMLDPGLKSDSVYNRYAYINVVPFINGTDSIVFYLNQQDMYTIGMDPCSEKLKNLGVKYFIFAYSPQPAEIRCMTQISSQYFPIYKTQ